MKLFSFLIAKVLHPKQLKGKLNYGDTLKKPQTSKMPPGEADVSLIGF